MCLVSRREYVFTSSRDEPFERRDEKKRNEHLVSIGGKCGTTFGQRKKQAEKSTEDRQVSSQIQVQRRTYMLLLWKPRHFQKDCRHLKRDKGAWNDVEPKKISEEKGTSTVATSEEELLFICEQASANLM